MPMSTFVKRCLKLLLPSTLGLILGACQSVPRPDPVVVIAPVSGPSLAPELTPDLVPVPEATLESPSGVEENEKNNIDLSYYHAALDRLKSAALPTAIDLLEQIALDTPRLPHLYTNLGLAYFKQGSVDPARKAFQQAIEINGDDAIAYNHLGILHRMQGEFELARQAYQKAIDLDQKYAGPYLNLGILYDIYLQKLDLALELYLKYQALTNNENESVGEWIVDIQRRI